MHKYALQCHLDIHLSRNFFLSHLSYNTVHKIMVSVSTFQESISTETSGMTVEVLGPYLVVSAPFNIFPTPPPEFLSICDSD